MRIGISSRCVLLAVVLLAVAVGATAAEPFIAIADVKSGRALVPDGTVVPRGVQFFVTNHPDAAAKGRVALVFAYAPASEFTAARKAIEAAPASIEHAAVRYVSAPAAAIAAEGAEPEIATQADPQWFYLYFSDGSYTSALRHVYTSGGSTYYGSGTVAYSAPGGYWTGTVEASLSSNLVWGPSGGPYFDPYGYSNSCTVNNSGGSCGTQYPYVGTSQSFSATVDSTGEILQRFPGCWTNPNSLCVRWFTGTIQITFP